MPEEISLIFDFWVLLEVVLATIGRWDIVITSGIAVFLYYAIDSIYRGQGKDG
jgi:hypothetical protein